jgi:hypothetical protein
MVPLQGCAALGCSGRPHKGHQDSVQGVSCVLLLQAVKAGGLLRVLVGLVGGSTSGFSAVVGAYVTTVTVTIAVSAVCALLAIMMYSVRADQRLRQDRRYGGVLPALWLDRAIIFCPLSCDSSLVSCIGFCNRT